MKKNILKIVTRKSALALWQANYVKKQLQALYPHLSISISGMNTSGDKTLDSSLSKLGGKGLFVKELEETLLSHEADIAVHSMKDVPSTLPFGLEIACILERSDPRDAYISNQYLTVESLPIGATIGTSSLRRQAQILALRKDLTVFPLRGNVDTRIQKLEQNACDAMLLAVSGLKRLKLDSYIKEYLDINRMLPGIGQGALGIECRTHDMNTKNIIKPLHHFISGQCLIAERHMNALLNGSCQLPVAGLAFVENNALHLIGMVASPDGEKILKAHATGDISEAMKIGELAAKQLLQKGASQIIEQCIRNRT